MKNKFILVGAVAILLIIGIIFLLRSPGKEGGNKPFFEMFSRSGSADQSILMQDHSPAFGEFIDQLKNGKVNFVWELWAMRAECKEDMPPDACDASILKFIDERYTSPEKEKLKDLFSKYFKYEATMREFPISSDLAFAEKYNLVKKKRREILGNDDSELVFGMEESQVEFLDVGPKLIAATKNLSGDERVKQYNALKKSTLGSYYDSVVAREDKYQNYETEMDLRSGDLMKLPEAERRTRTVALQEQYFGKEAADKIAQAQAEEAAEQKKLTDYQAKEKEFLSQNASMSDAQKKEKLQELRIQMLGKEEAEAYERREQFEQAVKNIK
ncbi:MAG: lipase chaperone [Spirochaetia bacterium]|nr:lipase chaperone [Spirochaetia bacterium]